MSEQVLERLIARLEAGEVIPDEDLAEIKRTDWTKKISTIIVASAGKPGQGVLTRIDPETFQNPKKILLGLLSLEVFELTFGLFPAKGKFDFRKAVTSLLGLLSLEVAPGYARDVQREGIVAIYLGFWLYHGTDANYRSNIWHDGLAKIRELEEDIDTEFQLTLPMWWDATEQQWGRFKRYYTIPFTENHDSWSFYYQKTLAPLPVIKLAIENSPPEYQFALYLSLLFRWGLVEDVYKEGGPGLQPKGSIIDFVNATSGFPKLSVDVLNNQGWVVLHRIFLALRKEDALNPASFKWFSELPFVKNAETIYSATQPVGAIEATNRFLVVITPGLWEKYRGPIKKPYEELLLETQKENRELIEGVVLALHGRFQPFAIPRIVMNLLPWERVWIGVGGKREHGKMAEIVEAYIRQVVESEDERKAKVGAKRGREGEDASDANKKARTRASSGENMSEDEVIEKLKQVFAIEITSST